MAAGVPGTPIETLTKDPDGKMDYVIDWAAWLDGDTISTSTWSVPSGITKSSSPAASNTTTTATIWLEGGTAGQDYDVINSIVTAAGREDDRTFRVTLKEK